MVSKGQKEELKAIVGLSVALSEKRIKDIQTFLDNLSLDTDVNKTVASELKTVIKNIEKEMQEMNDKLSQITG